MSELTILAAGFTLEPLINERDGPCEIRWYYNRAFLDSNGVQVQRGTGTTGFWITTPCSIASGLINVDQDTLLWTTDDARDPAPLSIAVSAGLYSVRGVLLQQLTIIEKTNWIVPASFVPTTTWPDFSVFNQAAQITYTPAGYYTAPEVNFLINRSFAEHPASSLDLGTVLLSVPADIPAFPVVWGINDPLVRDAAFIEGIPVSDVPPVDGQVLTYNQANNDAEWANAASGSGNVISNELSSVDGQVTLASGTGGKTIKFDASASFDGSGLLSGATVSDPVNDLDIANKEFVLASVAAAVQQTPNITALVQGGGVFWVSAYIFQVAAATYLIQGDLFTSAGAQVTLSAAHATLDRIDVIALDDTGTVVVIEGTAASQPSQPDVDPGTQLQLTFVFVTHNTLAPPTVSNTDIYLENTEWTATTSGTGWNVASTTNPYSGTISIEGTNVANLAYVQLQNGSPITLDTFAILSVFIASKAAWPKKRSLVFQFFSSGVAKGSPVTINTGFFGFDSTNTAYQLLAIPIAQFAVPAATPIDQLRITDTGGAIGMYIDNIVLQANGTNIGPPPPAGLTQAQADARYLQQANNLNDVASASTAINNILPSQATNSGKFLSTNGTVASWQTAGAGSSVPTTVQGDTLYASAVNTLLALPKDTNATRYLSNTGSSNNPAWAQVALGTGISGFGTGIATALGTNTGAAGAPVLFNGALGTPSSGALTSCTGLPLSTGVTGDLPFANLVQASAASVLAGRGSASGAGDFQEITLGSGLTMTGTVLSASGGSIAPLVIEDANTVAQRNSTNAQAFYVYGTFTSATNYERALTGIVDVNSVGISAEKGSGGGSTRDVKLKRDTVDVTLRSGEFSANGTSTNLGAITNYWNQFFAADMLARGSGAAGGRIRFYGSGGNAAEIASSTSRRSIYFIDGTTTNPYGTLGFQAHTITTLSADQNNYTVEGNASGFMRWSSTGTHTVTGLSLGEGNGEVHQIHNVGSGDIVLANESGSSTDVNRFHANTGADITIPANGIVDLIYDPTTQRYRCSLRSTASGGSIGGSTTQVQYNSSGSFAGSAQFVFTPASSPNIVSKTANNGHDNLRLDNSTSAIQMILSTADIGGSGQAWISENNGRLRLRTSNAGGGGAYDFADFNNNDTSKITTNLDGVTDAQRGLLVNNQRTVTNDYFRLFAVQNNGSEIFALRRNGITLPNAEKRVSSQFDKVNATLADVTGLSVNVQDKVYRFEADLYVNADATGGSKFAIACTATVVSIIYEIILVDNTLNTNTITSRQTSSGGSAGQAGTTAGYCRIVGTVSVSSAGALTVQFAQNTANGTSSVLVGSTLRVRQID